MPAPLLDMRALTVEADHHPHTGSADLAIQSGESQALPGVNGSGKPTAGELPDSQ